MLLLLSDITSGNVGQDDHCWCWPEIGDDSIDLCQYQFARKLCLFCNGCSERIYWEMSLFVWAKKSQCCQQNLAKEVQTLPISLGWKSHVLQFFRAVFFSVHPKVRKISHWCLYEWFARRRPSVKMRYLFMWVVRVRGRLQGVNKTIRGNQRFTTSPTQLRGSNRSNKHFQH